MKPDQASVGLLEDSDEMQGEGWWQTGDESLVPQTDCRDNLASLVHIVKLAGGQLEHQSRWAGQQPPLHEVEHHIRAVHELESWLGAVHKLSERQVTTGADVTSDLLDAFRDAGFDGPTREVQGPGLNHVCALLLQLLTAQVALALDHADLLEATYRMAITDGLTGVFNRRHFDGRLAEEIYRSARYKHPLSVIILDIDHFKRHNDRLGHLEADHILVQLARIVERSVRRGDMVARYGGDEFVILLPETDREAATVVAERVRRTVEKKEFVHCQVTISAGVATCQFGRSSPEELLAAADRALYRAKAAGRNCVWGPDVQTEGQCMYQVPVAGGSR